MNSDSVKPKTPLLPNISQFEVDFVIPRVGLDLPMGIDPFLLFKSRDPILSNLHSTVLGAFNYGVELVRARQFDGARYLFTFPEVSEIGFGYSKGGKRGSGVGKFLTELIIETLNESTSLLKRGVRHVEEMQLFSVGIGPDRVSDIVANLLKEFLIEYTQKQCELWNIPVTSQVPMQHVFEVKNGSWKDGYFDLPISPYDKTPMLFVPRRIVRTLPWINYDEFFRMEFSAYLRAKKVRSRLDAGEELALPTSPGEKAKVVDITRRQVERVDRYVHVKEETAAAAQPSLHYIEPGGTCPESDSLKQRLSELEPGDTHAATYQRLILEILNFLFSPELIDGQLEVRTIDGTERRDIIFTNDSDQTFWAYLRTAHASFLVMFESKNTSDLNNNHLNQTAVYLGDAIGRMAFLVTRNPMKEAQERKTFAIYNKDGNRKLILVISDADIQTMLDMKCQGKNPMRHLQKLYRTFLTRVQ